MSRPTPGDAVLTPSGVVVVSGHRVGIIVRLRNRRWLYHPQDRDDATYEGRTWASDVELMDEVFGNGRWA